MKETVRNVAIRTTAGIAAIAGICAVGYAQVDAFVINSPAKIEKRVEQLVPGYNSQELQIAQQVFEQVIIDFNTQEEDLIKKGAKTIEIPENVTQAATFIRDAEKTYKEGKKLSEEMTSNVMNRTLKTAWGGIVLFLPSAIVFAATFARPKIHRKAKETALNPAQTSS